MNAPHVAMAVRSVIAAPTAVGDAVAEEEDFLVWLETQGHDERVLTE
jgi:hypothetical protein